MAGWDEVPEALWPETLIDAVTHDVGALASPRVIATLRAWRAAAAGPHPDDALRWLGRVAGAIAFVDAPPLEITNSGIALLDEGETETKLPVMRGAPVDDLVLASRMAPPPPPPPPPRDFTEEEAEGTTASIPIARKSSRPPKKRGPSKAKRTRVSLVQVKALYGAIAPFCRELVPLGAERRSRRFWSYWREVSGDRGVRREFVENLLREAPDFVSLISGLIAEVQSADIQAVRAAIETIADSTDELPVRSVEPRPLAVRGASVRVSGVPKDED